MHTTKVVLIAPPPINLPASAEKDEFDLGQKVEKAYAKAARETKGYKVYVNKAVYAGKVMEIAKSYGNKAGDRVVGLDYWRAMMNSELKEQGLETLEPDVSVDFEDDDTTLPGSGLPGRRTFAKGCLQMGGIWGRWYTKLVVRSSQSQLTFSLWL